VTSLGLRHASVGTDGVRMRSLREAVVDVTFDDRRVWSFWLHRDGTLDGTRWFVPWPAPLVKYLDGEASVALVDTDSQEVLHRQTLRFGGGGAGRVTVTAPGGEPLAIDKSGKLVRTFETRSDEQIAPLLDAIDEVLKALGSAGVDPFLAYGTALGAVREGRVLGHDSDADLGYVSTHDHPVDVMRESFKLQRKLAALGYPVTRYSGAAFKVHVREADGHDRGLDVFAGFMREGILYLMGEVATPFRREWIYPTTTAYLSGRPFPVAADPDRFLTLAYGSGWRSPDPAFRFSTPASTIRRFDGWFRGMRVGRAHWDRYYSKPHRRRLREPSSLARDVVEQGGFTTYVDLGCGRGEDVRYAASAGLHAVGLDAATRGYAEVARELADQPSVEFQQVNVLETRQLLAVSAWAARLPGPRVVVVRHLVESLTSRGRQHVWRAARMMLAGTDGAMHLEFLVRRGKDGYAKDAGVRKRKRRREVLRELVAAGATIESEHVYDVSEHPRSARVCRVVARFGRPADQAVDKSTEQEGRS
jgi:hypothetical protein